MVSIGSTCDQTPEELCLVKRLVLVEDELDVREFMALLLRARGHTVFEAEDGEAGLVAIERERPDAALIDIHLPGMSGLELASRVRTQLGLTSVLLVACTAWDSDDAIEQARQAGFDVHVTKPADLHVLQNALAQPHIFPTRRVRRIRSAV